MPNSVSPTILTTLRNLDLYLVDLIDILFEHKLPARAFGSTNPNVFQTEEARAAAIAVEAAEDKEMPVHVEKSSRVC
jgi:hypothetical protein